MCPFLLLNTLLVFNCARFALKPCRISSCRISEMWHPNDVIACVYVSLWPNNLVALDFVLSKEVQLFLCESVQCQKAALLCTREFAYSELDKHFIDLKVARM